jgi:DNA-directed RNA polymerase subunit beta'
MRLRFFDVDEYARNLPEVKSSKIYTKTGFHPEGLFSLQIFGPVKTATCGCQQYWGRSMIRTNHKCATCGVDVTYSKVRRERLAKITLPLPVLNPIMYHLLIRAGKTKLKEIIENIIFNDKIFGYVYDSSSKRYIVLEKKVKERESDQDDVVVIPQGMTFYKSVTGLKDLILFEADRRKDKDSNWKIIFDNMDKFFINNILVPPPEFRPVSKNKDAQMRDEINRYLNVLLNFSLTMKDNHLQNEVNTGIYEVTARNLYKHVYNYYNYIFSKLSKKKGLIRGTILGKRVDFSGRAVIIPDPELQLGDCSIPYLMALELFKLEVCNLMLERRMYKRPDSALTKIDECLKTEDYSLFNITKDAVEGKPVMLNRQPTLHRMGILSFKAKVNSDYVIKIHPLVCEPYNADFDGDQMAIYRPLWENAVKECDNELSIHNNLVSPSTGDLILGVNQDVVLGIYLLTLPNENEKITIDGIETYKGRQLFVNCLPQGYNYLLDKVINKQILKTVLNDIARTRPPSVVRKVLDNIKDLGFKYTTLYGTTISLHGIDHKALRNLSESIFSRTDIDHRKKSELLESEGVKDQIRQHFPYSIFVDSGSRGNWDQAKQIVLAKGFVTNFKGEISKTPIKNSYIDGLNKEDFFNQCYGSRKGLLDTALNTGVSGYLTRKLVYATVNLERDYNCLDCGTDQTLSIKIPSETTNGIHPKKLARSLIGKYMVVGKTEDGKQKLFKITYKNYHTVIGQTIQIRSVIFCKNQKVCRTCYGEISETCDIIHSNYIGVIAAQALGEVSTQLVLRTFHTSGVAKITSDLDQHQDITSDLSRVNRIFHNSGQFLTSYEHALYELFKIYSEYKIILFVHFECIVSQMMRCGDVLWRIKEDRDPTNYNIVSIESIPSRESWLLALALSRPKSGLIDGVIDDSTTKGILELIMMNQI